ncbi:hypothetical protein I8748_21940 [Nostoc sp. CENA67]|uniref:Uncharacterized protein n=1 Tax=Amazonocrinis nigriterrae CENA67 TaxID=2794033 RepID=A0A8J7LB16_9NOST|nr:hypothetical protein [Amazonocrinis nigriterrae]MBH8564811.1 hypothetical protein [Amazonocrinis nigriterrae CENA67]
MSKIIYDVIQRFEVENGVPRLVSTNIQVIQGGEDLLSLATSLLAQMGFYDKFEENRTSQYIGYKFKNPKKGAKRYQLVLATRQEGLCISIPQDILKPLILELKYYSFVGNYKDEDYEWITLGKILILPNRRIDFLNTFNYTKEVKLTNKISGTFSFDDYGYLTQEWPQDFSIKEIAIKDSYIILNDDKLFPYTWQACLNSSEVLEEFLSYFAKILMEQQ